MIADNRLKLIQTLNSLTMEQLEQVIFALKPPPGIIPPPIASVGSRSSALLYWAESPAGCGLEKVGQTVREILNFLEQHQYQTVSLPESGSIVEQVAHRLKRNSLTELSADEARNRIGLLNKVKQSWIKGILDKSLHWKVAIDLSLTEQVELVDSVSSQIKEIPQENQQAVLSETSLVNVMTEIGEGATLLILGEPGSGKTITLLRLAQYLILQAEKDEGQPLPVVFNLSSWQNRFQSLEKWLLEEFTLKYQIPKQVAKEWIKNQQLQLLLDGLDEVSIDARESCVIALNTFLQNNGLTEVIVCSRFQDYLQLSNRLKFQQAINIQPLTQSQIEQYLIQAGQELEGVKNLLQEDSILAELARSPLMLSIMSLAYQGKSAEELLNMTSSSERRLHLFRAYIERMFYRQRNENKKKSLYYSEQKTRYWLKWLAQKMEKYSQTEFLIESMQPNLFSSSFERRIYQASVALVIMTLWGTVHLGLLGFHHSFQGRLSYTPVEGFFMGATGGFLAGVICGLLGGIIAGIRQRKIAQGCNGLIWGITYGTAFDLIWKSPEFGLAYGLIYGLGGCLIYRTIHKSIETVELMKWSWNKAALYALISLLIGLILILTGALGIIKSIIIALGLLFIFAFTKKNIIELKSIIPNQGIWNSWANATKLFITVGLITGLFMGSREAIEKASLTYGIVNALVDGTILGLLAGLIGAEGSGITCLKHLALRVILWQRGYIPWNYKEFLDYTVELVFLSRNGGSYSFIHRTLREYWAEV